MGECREDIVLEGWCEGKVLAEWREDIGLGEWREDKVLGDIMDDRALGEWKECIAMGELREGTLYGTELMAADWISIEPPKCPPGWKGSS